MRTMVISAALIMITTPAYAQDYTGNVNPSAWVGPTVMHGAINAQARRNGSRSGGTSQQVAACAQKSRFRAEYGAENPKVQRLYRLCRGIGR